MAERVGFEPTVRLPAQLISSQSHSTTLAPLRARFRRLALRDHLSMLARPPATRCAPLPGVSRVGSPKRITRDGSE